MEVGKQHLGVQPAVGEDDRLQIAFQKLLRDPQGFVDVAAADAKIAVDHRWVVEDEEFFSGGRAARVQHVHLCFQQARGQLARIGDGRGGANELGPGAIEARDASQTPQNVTEVAAENPAVSVQLVEHDVAEVLEQSRPAGVMRQNSGVQHVRVGQDDMALLADGLARVRGRVAVVGEHAEAVPQALREVVQFCELVLCQRLGGKQVEGARVGVFEHGVEHWQVVANRFA